MVVSNPSNESGRITFFKKLSDYKFIASGGKTLNNTDGPINNKLEFQSKFKFCIAFENSLGQGYTTEKILHAFTSGCIPIYWGNPKIGEDFNEDAFIKCHSYNNFDEVIELIKAVDQNKELADQYLRQPIFKSNAEPEYCKETVILEKFTKAFEGPTHISQTNKRVQKYLFVFSQVKGRTRRFLNALFHKKLIASN
jgi:hypothetical protein